MGIEQNILSEQSSSQLKKVVNESAYRSLQPKGSEQAGVLSQGMAIELGHREVLSVGISSQGCSGSPMPVPAYPYQDCPQGLFLSLQRSPGHANEVIHPQWQPCSTREPQGTGLAGLLLQSCKQISRAKAAEPAVMCQAWLLALARLLSRVRQRSVCSCLGKMESKPSGHPGR